MRIVKTKHALNRRFGWYLLIGGSAFVGEYMAFVVLSSLGVGLVSAQSLSFTIGLIVSFTGNRNITFNSGKSDYILSRRSQLWRYVLLAGINLLLSNTLIYVLVDIWGVWALIAKVVVMISVVCWNYAVFNRIIFQTK